MPCSRFWTVPVGAEMTAPVGAEMAVTVLNFLSSRPGAKKRSCSRQFQVDASPACRHGQGLLFVGVVPIWTARLDGEP